MEFKKKLSRRMYIGLAYIVIGIAMIAMTFVTKTDSEYFSSFGLILAVMGIVRVRNYFIISRSEDSIKRREIAETDERNISISQKARASAFNFFVIACCVAVVVLNVIGKIAESRLISYSVCGLILLYWIFYLIYQKKM